MYRAYCMQCIALQHRTVASRGAVSIALHRTDHGIRAQLLTTRALEWLTRIEIYFGRIRFMVCSTQYDDHLGKIVAA